uniref:Egg protein CP391S-like n=1 Tax=Schistosoma mansoni TaxID=6183 RepID=A0AA82N843_SCHMA
MRYMTSSAQLILFNLVVSLTLEVFNPEHACNKIDSERDGRLVFEGESHEYIQYYYYSRMIRLNQTSPIVNGTFEQLFGDQGWIPEFPLQFYGANVTRVEMTDEGLIRMYGHGYIGTINHFISGFVPSECHISIVGNLLALKWTFHVSDGTFKTTTLIHSNGTISFYYDYVTWGYENYQLQFVGFFLCEGGGVRDVEIVVDKKWVKNGTLVEYEVSGDCAIHNSIETCQSSATSNTKCFWCERANRCIVDNNKDNHDFKVNGCQIGNMITERNEGNGQRE